MIPRDRQLFAFGTHTNAFAGNIKALLLQEDPPRYKKIFIGKSKKIVQTAQNLNIEAYWKYSPKGIWYSLRAGNYLYSSYPSDINYWLSSRANYINVWHGTPLKKIERDVDTGQYALRNRYIWLFQIVTPYLFAKPDILLVASPYEKECFRSAFNVEDELFLELFPPRLQDMKSTSSQIDNHTKQKILYAPTWRDDHSFHIEEHLEIEKLDTFLGENSLMLYCKPHPSDRSGYDAIRNSKHMFLASKEDDIYLLLAQCDLLLTDYSSMVFEALYLDKKALLFCPDYEAYLSNSRTFYLDPCKDLCIETAIDTDTLIIAINNTLQDKNNTPNLPEVMKPYKLSTRTIEKIYQRL